MGDSNFNVLLYSDGSQQAFSAAVYCANLLRKMPNMNITIVQVQDSEEGAREETEYSWIDTWPVSPTSEWMKRVIEADGNAKNLYHDILTKTNAIFTERAKDISHQVIYCSPSITDTVDALLEYAEKKQFKLIIMGTRGLTTLKGLIFGCLAHNVLNRSPIPVLLIKKLPQHFIDSYCTDSDSRDKCNAS